LILNQQDKYAVNASRLGEYVGKLRQALRLGRRDWNVCLVNDREIKRLNLLHRGKDAATDVLSFPWDARPKQDRGRGIDRGRRLSKSQAGEPQPVAKGNARNLDRPRAGPRQERQSAKQRAALEFKNFLGDIVISVDTARRNARREGHSTLDEIRWLILHGLLHLLGYDHESDQGHMNKLELALRDRLGISG
jgi:probable rRNA maturation factor